MWDLSLSTEISLLAAVFALIAWFMGRTLCKSKEYQVRSQLTQQQRENERLESLLIKKDADIQQAYDTIKLEQQQRVKLESQYATSQSVYESLQKTHHDVLKELQSSQACHVKYEELNKHHTNQATEYLQLKELYQKTLVELQDMTTANKQQKIYLEKYQLDNERLTQDGDAQARTIATLQHSLENHQALLLNREQSIHELTYQLGKAESQHKQAIEKYQQDLASSNSVISDLRSKVATYEILSTIG